jgi:hypothetical protein
MPGVNRAVPDLESISLSGVPIPETGFRLFSVVRVAGWPGDLGTDGMVLRSAVPPQIR